MANQPLMLALLTWGRNACFAHVLDVQEWFHLRYPKDGKPKERYGK